METPKYIVNSFLYSGLAVLGCVVVGVPIAWILARTRAARAATRSTGSTR